ncbi:MAG: thiol:disulfide interchange protein DsbA/DsbL [Pseudomonadota bacterium]|nr:thiol:disulfide interchange protein DsbA/DsbL [Pseudomonadota bacterium]
MSKRFLLSVLLLFAPVASWASSPSPALVAGTDYELIENGQPFEPLAGKIEVVEVFGYWCHVCADFQPLVNAWKGKSSKDVRFTYAPLEAMPGDQFARSYYAAKATGALTRTHNAVFNAVHAQRTLPKNPTAAELTEFYVARGANAKTFAAALKSAATTASVNRAREFATRSNVPGTPSVIVNGKYRVLGRSLQDILRITDALIAQIRHGQGPAAKR